MLSKGQRVRCISRLSKGWDDVIVGKVYTVLKVLDSDEVERIFDFEPQYPNEAYIKIKDELEIWAYPLHIFETFSTTKAKLSKMFKEAGDA